jgi:hypothetical protein
MRSRIRIRIHIEVKSWMRIRIKAKSLIRIRIRINVMQIQNSGYYWPTLDTKNQFSVSEKESHHNLQINLSIVTSVADPNPVSGAYLTLENGIMGKMSGSRMNNPDHIS